MNHRDDYLAINRANWDSRVPGHLASGYGMEALLADPAALSDTVRFDLPRLGDLTGLDVVHLQCHVGTDTLSLARLGSATVAGLDLSGESLDAARDLARRAGVPIDYVQSDVYSAPEAFEGRTFDMVYTGIGALCWLPDIARWATTVATLLRPGGRLFVRDAHPLLNSLIPARVGEASEDRVQQPWISGPGEWTPALELPYFEQHDPVAWRDTMSYTGGEVGSPLSVEWNHSLGELFTGVLAAGLSITSFVEHDSVPWEALPRLMTLDVATGEYRLTERPERLPATFTLIADKA